MCGLICISLEYVSTCVGVGKCDTYSPDLGFFFSHALLKDGVPMLSHFSSVQLFGTPWTVVLPGPSVHGIL